MSDVAWLEVREAVEAMLTNLGKLAERNPEASMRSDDFDALLERAKSAFSASAAIRDVKKVEGVTTLADLFGKLSILQGAVKAAFTARNTEAIRRHNEEQRSRYERGR
jgi:hypothetical protein